MYDKILYELRPCYCIKKMFFLNSILALGTIFLLEILFTFTVFPIIQFYTYNITSNIVLLFLTLQCIIIPLLILLGVLLAKKKYENIVYRIYKNRIEIDEGSTFAIIKFSAISRIYLRKHLLSEKNGIQDILIFPKMQHGRKTDGGRKQTGYIDFSYTLSHIENAATFCNELENLRLKYRLKIEGGLNE